MIICGEMAIVRSTSSDTPVVVVVVVVVAVEAAAAVTHSHRHKGRTERAAEITHRVGPGPSLAIASTHACGVPARDSGVPDRRATVDRARAGFAVARSRASIRARGARTPVIRN